MVGLSILYKFLNGWCFYILEQMWSDHISEVHPRTETEKHFKHVDCLRIVECRSGIVSKSEIEYTVFESHYMHALGNKVNAY